MDKKNQDFSNTTEMFMRGIFLMGNSMDKEHLQHNKDFIKGNLSLEHKMDTDNSNGLMDRYLEEIIIEEKEKALANIIMEKIKVYQKECGEKEYLMERANIQSQQEHYIKLFGLREKYLPLSDVDNICSV